jgi:exosortase/archaeosortase family protein
LRDFVQRNRTLIKTWLVFIVVLAGFAAVDQAFFVWINTRLTNWTAEVTAWFLSVLGVDGRANDRIVWSSICSFEIIGECTAYYPCAIFISAVVAFPARWTRKAIGVGVGLPTLLLINQIRLVSLCYIQHWIPEYFETLHILVWQSLIVVLTVVLWLVWALTLAGSREAKSA